MPLGDGLTNHPSLVQRYNDLAEQGKLAPDPRQVEIARAFDALLDEITTKRLAAKKSSLGWLFAKRTEKEPIRGLYIHGGVGRGKTMLMDMFFELLAAKRKRRVHFNVFMADVHDRIHRHRQALKKGETKETDPVPPIAKALADEAWVLCFDEFSVTDIADAMILSRLFSALFGHGVVLVATSNVAPDNLYKDGLNRGLFTPFIGILKEHARILNLDSETDYRLLKLNRLPVYVTPLGPQADEELDRAWSAVTEGKDVATAELELKGRSIQVPRAAGRAARFDFADICRKALAARDYNLIADSYDTIFIDNIPVMNRATRNEAKRFILLIDTLYDRGKRLIASAARPPAELYAETSGTEAFEFDRTVSRLIEMQSHDWPDGGDAANRAAE
ncbi:cell division protein ZapE [Mesorhizobium sp. Z1-4]|uniref:cell division protein ZapE n=1 Tax=Mesorhizobium sp. Z1-4 TaxID=2448478 RepID=UPI000FD7DEB4|nr:cell division protein ZapE [Mesorhizobium sp. Z1-4]